LVLIGLFVLSNSARDLRDYFVRWPQYSMVRFLYRADYRQAAQYLDDHLEIGDAAVGSTLLGPWDRLALADDLGRQDLSLRFFNPERALILSSDGVLVTDFPPLDPGLAELVGGAPVWQQGTLKNYAAPATFPTPNDQLPQASLFDNGLELVGVTWPQVEPQPGREALLWLTWQVARPLTLPPLPIVANPPPPGVYNGPRLAVFTHLLDSDGVLLVGDDGLWVDPGTLLPGDRFVQFHRLHLPEDATPGPYMLALGLYDPLTMERWPVLDAAGKPVADHLLLPIGGRRLLE
jgi:hypothetical protein